MVTADTLFPVFDVPDIDIRTQHRTRPYKKSMFFDFEKGDFRRDGAYRVTTANGRDAYMQWCIKIVMTERDTFLSYSTDIGTEFRAAVELGDRAAVESAVERTITEALMVNVHTEYVRNFIFSGYADELYVTFTVKGKDWEEFTLSTAIGGIDSGY